MRWRAGFLPMRNNPARHGQDAHATRYVLHGILMSFFRAAVCALLAALAGSASAQQPALTRDDVLSLKDGRFFLDGKPFAEISFNKFDLFWQLWDDAVKGKDLDDGNETVIRQDKALKELKELGFRTIRIFASPWGGREFFEDTQKREAFFQALDKTYDLCDQNGIRVYASLGCGDFSEIPAIEKKPDPAAEHLRELVADPQSKSRQLLYEYLDSVVSRYKDRKTVVMWEISNEMTNQADIMPGSRVAKGRRMPTLKELASFYNDVTARIKAADPLRLVGNGGSHLRESAWNLYSGNGWKTDTLDQHVGACRLVLGDTAIDVADIHYYALSTDGFIIQDGSGGPLHLNPAAYMKIGQQIGKPVIFGEYGPIPHVSDPDAIEHTNKPLPPGWFESYEEKDLAIPWFQKAVDDIIEAGVPITYWWCYQSDRKFEKDKPGRFDVSLDLNPELVNIIAEGNRRLQEKLCKP